jgi:hypothetical protein
MSRRTYPKRSIGATDAKDAPTYVSIVLLPAAGRGPDTGIGASEHERAIEYPTGYDRDER